VLVECKPAYEVETIPIEVAIRLERNRIFDIEFDTGVTPSCSILEYMESERARGITEWPVNI
jgi:hypothetical protein